LKNSAAKHKIWPIPEKGQTDKRGSGIGQDSMKGVKR